MKMRWWDHPKDSPQYLRGKRRVELAEARFATFTGAFDRVMKMFPDGPAKKAAFDE